jgi:hypothetical protein
MAWLLAAPRTDAGLAECVPFYDGLEGAGAVSANGGVLTGSVTFGPGLKGSAAEFHGNGSIRYAGELFHAQRGSVSFWFKKNSADIKGGILQIGQLGQLNSMGLFYNFTDELYFEMRNASNDWAAISLDGALSTVGYTHIVATWDNDGTGVLIKLFVNGRYVDYRWVSGVYYHGLADLDIGAAGVGEWYGYGEGTIDELRFFDRPIMDSEVYAEYVYTSGSYAYQPTGKPTSTGTVKILQDVLLVDGIAFKAKGVGYQPVPVGLPISRDILDFIYTDPCVLQRDIPLLRQMNVNTVRFWSQLPDDETLLDELYNGGIQPIYALMGFWVPLYDGVDYSDPGTAQAIEDDFRAYVNRFKEHPAVLAWGIGNENNLAYSGSLADWYALANRLAEGAYQEEGPSYHPTVLINGGLLDFGDLLVGSDDASLNFVDMWGHNAYFGFDDTCYFDYYKLLSSKPLLITEYGIDAYDMIAGEEYQAVQADWVTQQWRHLSVSCVGGTVMAYSDEWWKAGNPDSHDTGGYFTDQHPDGFSNEEWWGIVAVELNPGSCDTVQPRAVYYALRDEFAQIVEPDGDFDGDGDIDLSDHDAFTVCFTGPDAGPIADGCAPGDFDADDDIDCRDWAVFTLTWTGPGDPQPFPRCHPSIPTLSDWGILVLALVLTCAGSIVFSRRRQPAT